MPGRVSFWRSCDISDPDQVDAFAAWLVDSVSSTVDVLVNNAGGTGLISDDASTRDAAEYALSMLSVNHVGTYLMVHSMRAPLGPARCEDRQPKFDCGFSRRPRHVLCRESRSCRVDLVNGS